MPRLIDELRAPGCRLKMPWFVQPDKVPAWKDLAVELNRILAAPDLPVLLIDNIAEFFFQNDQEYWDLSKDFPNLAPPYPAFWCEHRMFNIHSKEKGDTDVRALVPHGRIGMLVHALDPAQCEAEGLPPGTKWVLWCELYIDYGVRGVTADGPHGSTFFCIDAEGRLLERPWMQSFATQAEAEIMRSYMTFFNPGFLAVSFLHCKNVRVEDNRVDAPLAKKWRARHGVTPCVWKTLVIEPLRQILHREGRQGEIGLAKAMHICRGHFRDYREGRGLFGKYKQLVWMPSIVRGTKGDKAPPREIEVKI